MENGCLGVWVALRTAGNIEEAQFICLKEKQMGTIGPTKMTILEWHTALRLGRWAQPGNCFVSFRSFVRIYIHSHTRSISIPYPYHICIHSIPMWMCYGFIEALLDEWVLFGFRLCELTWWSDGLFRLTFIYSALCEVPFFCCVMSQASISAASGLQPASHLCPFLSRPIKSIRQLLMFWCLRTSMRHGAELCQSILWQVPSN